MILHTYRYGQTNNISFNQWPKVWYSGFNDIDFTAIIMHEDVSGR